jgi:hypothetical protein
MNMNPNTNVPSLLNSRRTMQTFRIKGKRLHHLWVLGVLCLFTGLAGYAASTSHPLPVPKKPAGMQRPTHHTLGKGSPKPTPKPSKALYSPLVHPVAERVVPWVFTYKQKHLNHLYSFEYEPLADQIPLVIVPGRAQEAQGNPWWEKLRDFLDKNPDVRDKYKVYIFLYDSKQPVHHTSLEFKQDFSYFLDNLPKNHHPIVVLTYSLGGLIVRDAFLEKPALMEPVSTIFSMSVPFHGTPLFDPEWMRDTFSHLSPIRRGWDKFFYSLYMLPKQHLVQAMGFVNFDQSKPKEIEPNEVLGLVRQPMKPLRMIHPRWEDATSEPLRAFKAKSVIYASYLKSQYSNTADDQAISALDSISQLNNATLGALWPTYVPSVHRSLEFMGREMAQLQYAHMPAEYLPGHGHPYRYNDGVIPASSLFYLPVRDTPYTEHISEYPRLWNICGGRFFDNLDHVDLGHYRFPEKYLRAKDVFHPEDGIYKPLEWLFLDLRRLGTEKGFPCGQTLLQHPVTSD